jgi:hypothetical protein
VATQHTAAADNIMFPGTWGLQATARAVTAADGFTFTVAGDRAAEFNTAGMRVRVTGTLNPGDFHVVNAAFNTPNTDILVVEAVNTDIGTDGTIQGGTLPAAIDGCIIDHACTLADGDAFTAAVLDCLGNGSGTLTASGTCTITADVVGLETLTLSSSFTALTIDGDAQTTAGGWSGSINNTTCIITGALQAGDATGMGLEVAGNLTVMPSGVVGRAGTGYDGVKISSTGTLDASVTGTTTDSTKAGVLIEGDLVGNILLTSDPSSARIGLEGGIWRSTMGLGPGEIRAGAGNTVKMGDAQEFCPTGNVAAVADVRSGTARYTGGGNGSLAVPATNKVLSPEPVDATTGTLTLPDSTYVLSTCPAYGVGGTGGAKTATIPANGTKVMVGEAAFGVAGSSITPSLAAAKVTVAGGGTYVEPVQASVLNVASGGAMYGPAAGTEGGFDDVGDDAAQRAAQLASDQAAIDAAKAGILETVTILSVVGTLPQAKVIESHGGTFHDPANSEVWIGAAVGVSPRAGTKRASSITNCTAGNVKNGVAIDDVTGTYVSFPAPAITV